MSSRYSRVLLYPHPWVIALGLIILPGLWLWGVELAQAESNANPGDILIVEVNADPASAGGFVEPGDEFFELYNNSGATINLTGWTVNDNGSTTMTLPNINLEAGKLLVVAHANINFALYGCTGANTPLSYLPSTWFNGNLANTNDRLILRDNLATVIDGLSYGTDTSVLNPAAPAVFDNSGVSLQRRTYNTAFVDTDTNADWTGSTGAGTPCDVSPTAVSLQSFSTQPTTWPLLLLVVVALLVGGTAVIKRKTDNR